MKAPTVCSTPGCPEIAVKGGKCDEHKSKRGRRPRQHYNNSGWKRTSARFLKDHPLCECDDCMEWPAAMRAPAEVVNHIVDVKDGGTDDPSNLQSMAKGHHSKHTARTKPGGFNAFQQRDGVRAGRVRQANPDRSQRRTG